MSKLTQWLDHRMEVVGLNRWKDLSEYSGICHQTIRDMNTCGSLLVLSRSDRRSLAAALRVSLRKLEQVGSIGLRTSMSMTLAYRAGQPLGRKPIRCIGFPRK